MFSNRVAVTNATLRNASDGHARQPSVVRAAMYLKARLAQGQQSPARALPAAPARPPPSPYAPRTAHLASPALTLCVCVRASCRAAGDRNRSDTAMKYAAATVGLDRRINAVTRGRRALRRSFARQGQREAALHLILKRVAEHPDSVIVIGAAYL
jgi:hypothetical protein